MPLQNRVTPFGEIIVTPDRGLFMGNRGCLHDGRRRLVRTHSANKRWILCLTEFKNRKRPLMAPGLYTELFFLDEATGLAAGHRPCAECRWGCFQAFKRAWLAGNPEAGLDEKVKIDAIDAVLHRERLAPAGQKSTDQGQLGKLPEGVFVCPSRRGDALLLWRGELWPWTPGGYGRSLAADKDEIVDVLTPPSTVNALAAGYRPDVHPSAG